MYIGGLEGGSMVRWDQNEELGQMEDHILEEKGGFHQDYHSYNIMKVCLSAFLTV